MPSGPLIDLSKIDLARVVAGRQEIDGVLKQRGRFAMIDGVNHMDLQNGFAVGFKEIRSSDWWASDHIPGRPLFPGALMIEAAAQLCTFHFLKLHPELENVFIGFGGLDEVRFRSAVEPDCRLTLVGKVVRERAKMFIYEAQGFVGSQLAFECAIRGLVV
jgi:3-hydroxyacyl-[acyl-carrier-protein] dehydratase